MSDRRGVGPEERRRRSLAREAQAFRQAFLQRFTFPGDRECLEHLGRMLDRLTEQVPHWPDPAAVALELEALAEVFEVLGRGDTTAVAPRARAISSSLRRELIGEMATLCSMG